MKAVAAAGAGIFNQPWTLEITDYRTESATSPLALTDFHLQFTTGMTPGGRPPSAASGSGAR